VGLLENIKAAEALMANADSIAAGQPAVEECHE
jgi:hypothetical protein